MIRSTHGISWNLHSRAAVMVGRLIDISQAAMRPAASLKECAICERESDV